MGHPSFSFLFPSRQFQLCKRVDVSLCFYFCIAIDIISILFSSAVVFPTGDGFGEFTSVCISLFSASTRFVSYYISNPYSVSPTYVLGATYFLSSFFFPSRRKIDVVIIVALYLFRVFARSFAYFPLLARTPLPMHV